MVSTVDLLTSALCSMRNVCFTTRALVWGKMAAPTSEIEVIPAKKHNGKYY